MYHTTIVEDGTLTERGSGGTRFFTDRSLIDKIASAAGIY